jgi:hypothetical protein
MRKQESARRPHKYHAVPTVVDGIRFASKAEAKRYRDLKLLQHAGEIEDLQLQPRWPCVVNDIKVCTYVADFKYWCTLQGCEIIEDVKGMPTPVYKLKKKLVEALHDITITEITS